MLVTSIISNFAEFVYFVKILGVQVFTMPMTVFYSEDGHLASDRP